MKTYCVVIVFFWGGEGGRGLIYNSKARLEIEKHDDSISFYEKR